MIATGNIVRLCSPEGFWTPLDEMALIIGALGHDVGHEGYNNDFYVKCKAPLALRYNDAAVLESMHAAKLYEIASKEENNWMAVLTDDQWTAMRKLVLLGILNTDMKVHFDLVKQTQDLAELVSQGT